MSHLQHHTKRVSIDLPLDEHLHLKIACARQGVPIRQFIVNSIENSLKELEEKLDQEAYDRGKKEIEMHGTISLEEMDRLVGYHVQSTNQQKRGQKTRKSPQKRLRKTP